MMIKLIKTLLVAAGIIVVNYVILACLAATSRFYTSIGPMLFFFGLFQPLIFVPLAIVVRRRSRMDRMIRFWGILLGSILTALLNILFFLAIFSGWIPID